MYRFVDFGLIILNLMRLKITRINLYYKGKGVKSNFAAQDTFRIGWE